MRHSSYFLLLTRCENVKRPKCLSYFSLVPGRMSVPKLADWTLGRTDLAHSGSRQILHVSFAKRISACRQTKHDFVEFRKRAYGPAIRAWAGGSGREDPLQQHKIEWRAHDDDDDAGGTLHCRLVRSSYFSYFIILHFIYVSSCS